METKKHMSCWVWPDRCVHGALARVTQTTTVPPEVNMPEKKDGSPTRPATSIADWHMAHEGTRCKQAHKGPATLQTTLSNINP